MVHVQQTYGKAKSLVPKVVMDLAETLQKTDLLTYKKTKMQRTWWEFQGVKRQRFKSVLLTIYGNQKFNTFS